MFPCKLMVIASSLHAFQLPKAFTGMLHFQIAGEAYVKVCFQPANWNYGQIINKEWSELLSWGWRRKGRTCSFRRAFRLDPSDGWKYASAAEGLLIRGWREKFGSHQHMDREVIAIQINRLLVSKHFLFAWHCAIEVHWLTQGKQELYS